MLFYRAINTDDMDGSRHYKLTNNQTTSAVRHRLTLIRRDSPLEVAETYGGTTGVESEGTGGRSEPIRCRDIRSQYASHAWVVGPKMKLAVSAASSTTH